MKLNPSSVRSILLAIEDLSDMDNNDMAKILSIQNLLDHPLLHDMDRKETLSGRSGNRQITLEKNGYQYGNVKTMHSFEYGLTGEKLVSQAKELYQKGYTQQRIATVLGKSQPTVSRYLHR